jgi:hypothetical protein
MPDGRLVTAVKGSSATTVSVSSDKGATWSQVTTMSSFEVKGIAYSKFRQAVYVWRWDCGTTVWNDWIQRYGYP